MLRVKYIHFTQLQNYGFRLLRGKILAQSNIRGRQMGNIE